MAPHSKDDHQPAPQTFAVASVIEHGAELGLDLSPYLPDLNIPPPVDVVADAVSAAFCGMELPPAHLMLGRVEVSGAATGDLSAFEAMRHPVLAPWLTMAAPGMFEIVIRGGTELLTLPPFGPAFLCAEARMLDGEAVEMAFQFQIGQPDQRWNVVARFGDLGGPAVMNLRRFDLVALQTFGALLRTDALPESAEASRLIPLSSGGTVH